MKARATRARVLISVLLGLSFAAALGSWALSTAPGGVPDDPYHQTLIWCGWGESDTCQNSGTEAGYLVPEKVGRYTCFIRKPDLAATCIYANTERLAESYGLTIYGLQATLGETMPYHRVMRIFVGTDSERSIIAIRLANAALAGALLAFTLFITRPAIRRSVALAWLVCVVPIGAFIIPSANPNSWSIIGVGLFWALFLNWVTAPNWRSLRSWLCFLGAIITAAMAISARSDGALFIGVSVLAVGILAIPSLRRAPLRTLVFLVPLPFVVVGLSIKVWPRIQNSIYFLQTAPPQPSDPTNSQLNQWVNHLLELPTMLAGLVGGPQSGSRWPNQYFLGLGYLDTSVPSITAVLCVASVAGVCFWGLTQVRWRKGIVLALVLGTLCFAIYFPIAALGFNSGNIQARHVLPLLFLLVGICTLVIPWRRSSLSKGQVGALVAALSLANSAALLSNLRRYTNGEAQPYFNFDLIAQWWWVTTTPAPLPTWLIGSVAAVSAFILLGVVATTPSAVRR